MKTHFPLRMLAVATVLVALAGCDVTESTFADGAVLADAQTTVVITEGEVTRQPEGTPPTNNWVLYTRTPASQGDFVAGPATPPAGIGSFWTETPTGGDKVYLFNYDQIGTALADVDAIGYATYRSSASTGSGIVVPSLNMEVDRARGVEGYVTLVYEPYYNAAAQGAVMDDEWQDWDAYDGGEGLWWATRDLDLDNNGTTECPRQSCFFKWSDFVAAYPDSEILGAFGINQGSGNPGTFASSDRLHLSAAGNGVTYDFEPYRVAQTKDDCKNGGWQVVRRADGSTFRNQGDCIQYVNTGR